MKNVTEVEVRKMLSNPFYCVKKVDDIFVETHETLVSEKDWIKSNAILIKEMGEENWLKLLLENLKGNYVT
jgi:hypothetical protein